ncbi:hypothetical protein FK535_16620 [Mycolicibacterium sp. 018/SC-01/001]|uniref:hypothetical protein n=1 Tax=Mycolicibacterium sp. 018/SC-01/001 TaxID=2592069 RepID=UPI00117D3959|nr:hypothetical protein [Mycolicibacterium sp. 018/SC-01/001]TRW81506.1 hypothetical protein FK535_16620 [Mycolicibacterium sp. 018/SC-01/001]
MNAGCYVGRIGGLAVALGVGAAVVAGQGVAYADSTGSGSSAGSTSDASGATAGGQSGGTGTAKEAKQAKEAAEAKDTTTAKDAKDDKSTSKDGEDADAGTGKKDRKNVWADLFKPKPKPGTETDDPSDAPEVSTGDTDESPATGDGEAVKAPSKKPRWSWKPADAGASTDSKDDAPTVSDDVATTTTSKPAKGLKGLLANISVDAPEAATTPKTLVNVSTATSTATTTTEVAAATDEAETTTVSQGPLVTLFKKFLDAFTGNSPATPGANSPFAWLVAAASRREVGAEAQQDDPTMVWNGLEVVPVGEPTITSFYGKYTMVPAFPGVLQGTQDFDLVDPDSGAKVATIHGLVAMNNDLGSGNRSLQIVVKDITFEADGAEVGVDKKDIPPIGSVFAVVTNGRGGTQYSALAQEGNDVVSYRYITRFGSFRMNPDPFRINYSAADFLTDYVGINRPIHTTDGYYIAPVTPSSMESTGFVAYEPLFNAIQGTQKFGVYKEGTNELMGTFDGVVTVTSDFWGTTSEAIIVTSTDGDSGVEAGDIPPVGSVYNIIYWKDEFSYALYYSKPQDGKDIVKTLLISQTRKGQVVDELPINFNASEEPSRDSYSVGDYTFKPTSDILYSGVNGLPPREVIVQGYQQFDVFNAKGEYIGSVDADVSTQWNISRGYSKAILVTDVNDFENGVGTDKGDVPPVGSIFNFKYTGNSPFGEAYYSMPDPNGDKTRYELRTIFGAIPLFNIYNASKGLADYNFYSPFDETQRSNLLSLAGPQSGGLLGANQDLCVLDASACFAA